ncbi:MAG TPA: ester cyclase [Polyangiaceae bacterium]
MKKLCGLLLWLVSSTGCVEAQDSAEPWAAPRHADRKRHTLERYFNELFNQGKVELVPELLHPRYVNGSPGSPDLPRGRDGVVIVVQALRRAFPDLHYTIEDMVIGSDAIAVRTTLRGTHRGDFFGHPPTGKSVEVSQITIERFHEGKIIAHHRVTDELALQRQLGFVH